MSDYPNHLSEPTVTQYEGFEIAVRTSTHTWGHALNEISAMFVVSKAGNELLTSSVAGGYPTSEQAAANALRIAKLAIFERLDGPEPASN